MAYGRFDRLSRVNHPDSKGLSESPDRQVIIETAEVTRVDVITHTVDARSHQTGRKFTSMDVPSNQSTRSGGFNGSMPEVGDMCLVAMASNNQVPYILRMMNYPSPNNLNRGRRKSMQPGDSLISTGYGNYVHVHSGGMVDIAANPITRRVFVPILNQIKDFCENYYLQTPGGSLRWEVKRDKTTDNGGAESELLWEVRGATEDLIAVRERRGAVSSTDDMPDNCVYDWRAYDPDGQEVYRVSIDAAGNVLVLKSGDVTEATAGKRILAAEDGVTLFGGDVTESGAEPSAARNRLKVSQNDGVELGRATEPGVLGDALKSHLASLVDAITPALAAAVNSSLSPADPAVSARLTAWKAQLAKILAKDTKLS